MSQPTEAPFRLAVPDAELDLLHKKLALTRLPDELDDAGWEYGAPLADVRRLVNRWKDGFDWRAAEANINRLPQFTRDIEVDGFGVLNIHYVHQKSTVANAIPLLFLHGWPGSFLEVQKLLPILTAASPDHPSFHVVAPSLPNFGFSQGVKQKGFGLRKYAEAGDKLMLALGYNEYVIQGGDWGSAIARVSASIHERTVKAYHLNGPYVGEAPSPLAHPILYLQHLLTPYSPAERAGIAHTRHFDATGRGYYLEQATCPQTIGYALADSPVGLLAWIYEKLVHWTDAYPWADDEVLTWISVYWFSRAGPAASARIYYEREHEPQPAPAPTRRTPCGVSFFPKELLICPRTSWAGTVWRVVFASEHTSGGHFAAHERPHELAADLRAMFGKGGAAFGVVPGRAGYD